MPLDLSQVAAQAARAGGNENRAVAALPDSLEAYLADLMKAKVILGDHAATIKLLAAKEKVEAVKAATEQQLIEAVAPEAVEESAPDAPIEVVETGPDGEPLEVVIAAAKQLDADIEARKRRERGE